MAVTIRQVAEHAKISLTTVSRVLNGRGPHSEETKQLVLQSAQALGYRANGGARAMRLGKFGNISLVLSSMEDGRSSLPPQLLSGVTTAADGHAMHVSIAQLGDDQLTSAEFLPRFLQESTSDGMLVNYHKLIPSQLFPLLSQYRIPSVWLNYKGESSCVYPDDFAAGKEAVRLMIEAGHRRIAYVSFSYRTDSLHYSEVDRRDGYLVAMREAGLPAAIIDRYQIPVAVRSDHAERTRRCIELLRQPDRPTAVIAYGLTSLNHVIRAVDRTGLQMPRDISVLTYHADQAYVGEPVTTLAVPNAEVGRLGVELLLRQLGGGNPAGEPPQAVPFQLIKGNTLAAPSAA